MDNKMMPEIRNSNVKQPEEIFTDGMNAYDILRKYPECPIKLPHATSMTQARMDYYHYQQGIHDWYKNNKPSQP